MPTGRTSARHISRGSRRLRRMMVLTISTTQEPRCRVFLLLIRRPTVDECEEMYDPLTHLTQTSPPTTATITERKQPDLFGGIFAAHDDPHRKPDKEEERKVKGILERLRHYGIDTMVEANVEYALRAPGSNGDSQAAFRLLMLLQDTYEGIVKPFDSHVRLLGAVNRDAVTCYLDALLFAMFARLDSFEAMVYDSFEDMPRRKLAGLLRLWVNMLRSGRLITTDITMHLQNAMADCGWADAAKLKQQDPSEAFTFITGQLELPLLTLKMDLYHTGKEDPQDDHKFVNERLLEVAILDAPLEGNSVITLEDCLEHYFNNRIEVKRHLENRRRNTLKSTHSVEADYSKVDKEPAMHVEVVEVSPDSPLVQSPRPETPMDPSTPSQSKDPLERLRPTSGRKRTDSIFSQRRVELMGIDPEELKATETNPAPEGRERKMSTRTEVLMPAWQFFKLLPWYTDHLPTSDAQVAAHFAKKRPVLGICLKRYSYSMTGEAKRRNDYVDIPLEIAVPNFVSDDNMDDEGPLVGNFRLMLQSVVCHRGISVHSGHYITLCRGRAGHPQQARESQSDRPSSSESDSGFDGPWMRFDDLAKERVSQVDINEALKQETPYLLFYQVQPIGEDGHSIHDLPSYAEATSRSQSDATNPETEKPYVQLNLEHAPVAQSESAMQSALSLQQSDSNSSQPKSEAADFARGSSRISLDAGTALDPRNSSDHGRRRSILFDEGSLATPGSVGGSAWDESVRGSVPTTPADERSGGFLSVASKLGSRRGSRISRSSASRSRPSSVGPEDNGAERNGSRFSLNMSRLTQRMSKSDVTVVALPVDDSDRPRSSSENAISGVHSDGSAVSVVSDTGRTDAAAIPASSKPLSSRPIPVPAARKDKVLARHEKMKSKMNQRAEDRECVVM